MNPEIKAKWLDALRSGEYKQTRYRMKTGEGFCCLGVLCDLYAKEHNTSLEEIFDVNSDDEWDTENYKTSYVPSNIEEWAGLDRTKGFRRPEGIAIPDPDFHYNSVLATINDRHNDFVNTSAWIEENL